MSNFDILITNPWSPGWWIAIAITIVALGCIVAGFGLFWKITKGDVDHWVWPLYIFIVILGFGGGIGAAFTTTAVNLGSDQTARVIHALHDKGLDHVDYRPGDEVYNLIAEGPDGQYLRGTILQIDNEHYKVIFK